MRTSDLDYAYLRELVQTHSSNLLDPSRNALFDTRLAPIARLAGASSLHDFVNLLRTDRPAHLHRAVAEAMTVTETSFFRDPRLFDTLRASILPTLIRLRSSTRRLRIWSAACSTGQEAFSLAILLDHLLPRLADWDIQIVGTDISRSAIDYAQRGHFRSSEIHRGLTTQLLAQHFTPHDDEWLIAPRLSALCHFRVANLCEPLPPLPRFDLILLRNVLLYFSPVDRTTVLTAMHHQLTLDGCLVLGDSEQAEDSTTLFQPQVIDDTYLYRPIP